MEKRSNVKLTLDQGLAIASDIRGDLSSVALADILGVKKAHLLRRSVDARKKSDVHFVATVGIGSDATSARAVVPLAERNLPILNQGQETRPVVIGMGPAGLFAALELAEAGLRPLVIERGAPVEERAEDIAAYHKTRVLNTKSNVQFGEGGAGTFSDGKLTTGKNSPHIRKVLETFVAAGAPLETLWQAKPHIGTDILGGVIKNIRKRIIACGGDAFFHAQLVGMEFDTQDCLKSIVLERHDGSVERIEATQLVLATGHSARDTFSLLRDLGFEMEQKPFSLGVRIEHLQEKVNEAQYGSFAGHPALGAADYKLSCHLESGRSVYSFCMCPGGEVVAASTEEEGLCVNGMSEQARAGRNANSALLCNVTPEDFDDPLDPLAGVAFQRRWEHAAFSVGGADGTAPISTVVDFMGVERGQSHVEPSYPLGVKEADIRSVLPEYVGSSLASALPQFDKKIKGFAGGSAIMTGIEARSSSPVRVVRDSKSLQAISKGGVYPCGEGAGYAGGIMSAAVDGIRVAQAIMSEAQDL